jgi:Zn-dependent peptidase ImmA (M78 family)
VARSPTDAARLDAVAAAKQLHRDLDLERRVTKGHGFVDVFGAIDELDIPLVFKPLTSALGLCLPAPLRGIMITTQRGLHIQRFTGAHELAHVVMEHRGSIDTDVIYRASLSSSDHRDLQEVAADAFAAEFLMPRWLYRHHIQSQGWTVARHLRNPDIIYQLSLRMGVSYEAACWGLLSHQILPRGEVDHLLKAAVSKLKSNLSAPFRLDNSWSDVWRVTMNDHGHCLLGNPDDLLRIELDEHTGSGHQWQVNAVLDAGYDVLLDESKFVRDPLHYGADTLRCLLIRPSEHRGRTIMISERQQWKGESLDDATFILFLALDGREIAGLSRAAKRRIGLSP